MTTISWTTPPQIKTVEVRVGKPDGSLMSRAGTPASSPTGNWVNDGMVFYLQDVTQGQPPTDEHTLATVMVHLTSEGCPPVAVPPFGDEPSPWRRW